MIVRKACIAMCFCLTLSSSLLAQTSQKRDNNKSCGEFVKIFYTWYVAIALKDNPVPASDFALKERPYAFSPELLRQLKENLRFKRGRARTS